jgi:SAM-dependent methyltransferase
VLYGVSNLWLVIIGFLIIFFFLSSSLIALALTRVPVVRTPQNVIEPINEALALKAGDVLVDAGCGDGRTLSRLCSKEGVQGRGYDLNALMCLVAWCRSLSAGRKKEIHVRWADFFRCDLEDATCVYCYMMPAAMPRVAAKCLEEMPPGSRLVSYLWAVPNWCPVQVLCLGPRLDPVYIYEIPRSAFPADVTNAENPV